MRNVIYIDRNYLYFYGGNVHAPIPLQFQPTTVKDMELINFEELEKQIDTLVKTNKILPDETGIVIAHQSSFEKLIPSKVVGVELETEKKKFLDNVPFEDIMYKEFPAANGIRLIAVNKELIYAIKNIFLHRGFRIVAITSVTALYPENDVPFNLSLAQQFIKKTSQLNQATFPVEDIEIASTDTYDESNKPPKNNNRMFLLAGVFIILIGALVALLLLRKPEKEESTKKTLTPIPVKTVTAIPSVASPSAGITQAPSILPSVKTGITIQILNGSGQPGQADELKVKIEEAGYKTVSTGNAPTIQSNRSLVVFKPAVSQEIKTEITNLITEMIGPVSVQSNTEISGDVVITTAQSDSPSTSPSQKPQ
jgi:hypothetical protein